MIESNPDFGYIKDACPAYVPVFQKYNDELVNKYGLELGMELDDHTDTKLRFWVSRPYQRERKETHEEAQILIEQLNKQLSQICSQCGCDYGVSFSHHYRHTHHYVNQMYLCKTCNFTYGREEYKLSISSFVLWKRNSMKYPSINDKNPLKTHVRFINSFKEFDYARFENYFFHREGLYVKTEKEFYRQDDEAKQIFNTIYSRHITPGEAVIKVIYAGHDTGFRDDTGSGIFTGDIIRLKGSNAAARDPASYLTKERYIPEQGEFLYDVIGVVSCNSICNYAYQVILDNQGAFLCHGSEMEVLGNIFYNLNPDQCVDIFGRGCSIEQWGFDPNWNIDSRETLKEKFKKINTPSFIKTEKSNALNQEKSSFLKSLFSRGA